MVPYNPKILYSHFILTWNHSLTHWITTSTAVCDSMIRSSLSCLSVSLQGRHVVVAQCTRQTARLQRSPAVWLPVGWLQSIIVKLTIKPLVLWTVTGHCHEEYFKISDFDFCSFWNLLSTNDVVCWRDVLLLIICMLWMNDVVRRRCR